jgi:PP-loop superfamily ATP-utilizing enzyme
MIGFSSVIIDPDGYKSGKLNLIWPKSKSWN